MIRSKYTSNKNTICGAPEGYDAWLMTKMITKSQAPILHITRDDRRLAATQDALKLYAKEYEILIFPAWDCPQYSSISPNSTITSQRMATLTALAEKKSSKPLIVLTTLNAAMQRVPEKQYLAGNSFNIKVGSFIEMDTVISFLSRVGYRRSPSVHAPGEYAVRGGILDLFPAGEITPVRLDFFGDQLDAIRRFDSETQMTVGQEQSIQIGLDKEYLIDKNAIALFRRRFRAQFDLSEIDDKIYRAVSDGLPIVGLEHWLPFFHESLVTIFDYLPTSIVCIDDGIENLCREHWDKLSDFYQERIEFATGQRRPQPTLSPEHLHMNPSQFIDRMSSQQVSQFVGQQRPLGPGIIDAGGRVGRSFKVERMGSDMTLMESVANHLIELRKSCPVIVACWSKGSQIRFASMLNEVDVKVADILDISQLGQSKDAINLTVVGIEHGFVAKDLAVVSEQDIFGDKLVRKSRKRRSSAQLLAEAGGFMTGDLVVHEENGIGRYIGLETIKVANSPHDCAVIEYRGGTRLFLPVINIDLLSKYGSGDANLDRLGSANWQERKARMKRRLKDIADELLQTEAKRSMQTAPVIIPENLSWDSFVARFQFRETEDQAQAVEDVLADFRKGSPMDRLICGDVGFGKTEVAMRAAFITALEGLQVAIIAPTTLLVRQHFENFRARFAGFPIVIKQLSRTVRLSEVAQTKQSLSDGSCDIVIGTHALLTKSIDFKNLGLVVIDEEQIFGVAQKERLKTFSASVHVLSLTATPIPRTLQMALSGARDLSIISTPPVDRLTTRTYVLEFDPVTIRSAILHEYYRGGQCFIVVPRISDLPELEEFLTKNVPEVSFVVAHGQLPESEMESRITEFYDGKCKLLLSTTIIASGIDIPLANTIIIIRSDRFGLAQLYQIRGRVGRSGIRAYAYITYNPKTQLTDSAQRRLKILSGLDTLGAGFSLAAQDLDLRGGGNLLGRAQSGHIREVGVELYQKMLADAVAEIKSSGVTDQTQPTSLNPQINLRVSARIPETYVSDLSVRIGLYRRIGSLFSVQEIESLGVELIDRFGDLPKEVELLLQVVRIKLLCKQAGVSRLDAGPKGGKIEFFGNSFSNTEGLLQFISAQNGTAIIREDKLILRRNWELEEVRMKGASKLAYDISRIAANSDKQ